MHRVTIRNARRATLPVLLCPLLAGLALPVAAAQAGAATHQAASMPSVATNARDFAAALPARLPAGMIRFTYRNDGGVWQGMGIARLKAGVGAAAFTAVLKTGNLDMLDPLAVPYGGVGAGKGASEAIVVTLPAGHYALFDTEQGAGGKTVYAAKFFSVVGAPSSAATMPTAATITLQDMKFVAPAALPSGTHTFKIYNDGPSEHMMSTARIARGKTYNDVLAYLKQGAAAKGAPPVDPTSFGGLNTMGPEQTAYLTETFAPGTYVMLCFVTDPKKHVPHVAEGMVKQFTVR